MKEVETILKHFMA